MEILILEDEIPAFKKLHQYLTSYYSEKFEYDWARSNFEANEFLKEKKSYNIILSDIQLLDGNCFDIAHKFPPMSPIIFCTAYDQYLLEAFNTNGIGYILKPFTQEQLYKALEKFKMIVGKREVKTLNHEVVENLKNSLINDDKNYKSRFVVKKKSGIILIDANEISSFEAAGDFCIVNHFKGGRHSISQNIGSLVDVLNPKTFYRINRSQIINIKHINNIENHFKNRLIITLEGLKEKVMTSSGTTSGFRIWLEG